MSLPSWDEGSDSDQVRGVNWDSRLTGHRKILAWQLAKLPCYGREGAVEVRPFPAETRLRVSEAQGLSGEAAKGNPVTAVSPESMRAAESSNKPKTQQNHRTWNSVPGTFPFLARQVGGVRPDLGGPGPVSRFSWLRLSSGLGRFQAG
ncbi:hypothetical protein E6H34_01990 [Candidatus Bathyarchaeota archaeon]|nr:MAG: hypothetical protein E6H34_01990 [Candidatus Bathyarchaeota archaeon]